MSRHRTCLQTLERAVLLFCATAALGLGVGCGDKVSDAPQAPGAGSAGPHAPTGLVPSQELGAAELLGRIYRSVALGPALATKDLSLDVVYLRELLWPDLTAQGAEPAALTHVRASHVAGSIALELAADPGARDGLAQRDRFGLTLHDAWVAAAAAGPERYSAWCAGEAQSLFAQHEEELQRLFDRPLR